MPRIVKTFNVEVVKRTTRRCRERGITIPTFKQMPNPDTAPDSVKARLKNVGLWDVDPANLFRITWKNEPETSLSNGRRFRSSGCPVHSMPEPGRRSLMSAALSSCQAYRSSI